MKNRQQILNHDLYKKYLKEIHELEIGRVFCLHNMEHLVDVENIMYKLNMKYELGYEKKLIYGAALLHDIGKSSQYKDGMEHTIIGAQIATDILRDCNYSKTEIEIISSAIKAHSGFTETIGFSELLRKADKLSRKCYQCEAVSMCKWPKEMRNKRSYL